MVKPRTPIYFDWNATTPPHPEVVRAMVEAHHEHWANASSVHQLGRLAKERIEQVRAQIARDLMAHPRDLLFTSGGTEANNLALADAPALVTSRLEHPSVLRVAEVLAQQGKPVAYLPVTRKGQVDSAVLPQLLEPMGKGAVVAVQAVNHETGVVQPLETLHTMSQSYGAWLHVDAVQAACKLAAKDWLHGDSFALAAHKLRGPKGVGALVWRCGRPAPKPVLRGGSQQRGFRPGTLDAASIIGFGVAWSRRFATGPVAHAELSVLRDRLEALLAPYATPNVCTADGSADTAQVRRLSHVSSLYVPGLRGEELVAALDLEGVCISSGSACSAGTAEPSPVITAMFDSERAHQTVRVSLGEETTLEEIDYAVAAFARVAARGTPQTLK